ncbi:MAG: SAM-dependent methyltransferase [Cellulomonadaceae bacterium]|jgi:hypothetical protein|nr:SAM-dependent methyltransferase [Cellulomonadaceae bacterium]
MDVDTAATSSLIKSKHRVRTYGEVNTPPHMVKTMLDLVKDDLEITDRTFFEPAAGDGNFLTAILKRKLHAIERRIVQRYLGQEALFALASIYGVELLADNHADAQAAMLEVFETFCVKHQIGCGSRTNEHHAAEFLISRNILQGNTLTAEDPTGAPLTFSWWHRVKNFPGQVRREPFTLRSLREAAAPPPPKARQKETLFSMFDEPAVPDYAICRIDHVHRKTHL